MSDMRSPGFASEVATDPTQLRSIGYADVWKGEHQGRYVAVKVLRVYSTSNLDKVATVGFHSR